MPLPLNWVTPVSDPQKVQESVILLRTMLLPSTAI